MDEPGHWHEDCDRIIVETNGLPLNSMQHFATD